MSILQQVGYIQNRINLKGTNVYFQGKEKVYGETHILSVSTITAQKLQNMISSYYY